MNSNHEIAARSIATISSLTFPLPETTSSNKVELEIFLEDPDSVKETFEDHVEETMKVANVTYHQNPSKNFLLPLQEDPEDSKLTKDNSVKYALRCVRGNPEPKYNIQIRILTGNETVRQVLKWRNDVTKLEPGLDLTTVDTIVPVLETVMTPIPFALFHTGMNGTEAAGAIHRYNAALAAAADDAARNVIRGRGIRHYWEFGDVSGALNYVVEHVLPHKVLARVKRSLRRDMRKPSDMSIRKYWGCLSTINCEEVTMLPPFGIGQQLSGDEMVDIVLYGCPKSWSKELDRQSVDPYELTPNQLISKLESIEASEDFDPTSKTVTKKKVTTTKSSNTSKKSDFYCLLHGKNHTHDTDDCTKLKTEAKRLKGDKSKSTTKTNNNNKSSWKKKATDASDKAKSEITALVKSSVKKAVKDLKAADKKRKSSKKDDDSEDLNVIDNLEAFNYAASKLSLDDDSSSSGSGSEVSV